MRQIRRKENSRVPVRKAHGTETKEGGSEEEREEEEEEEGEEGKAETKEGGLNECFMNMCGFLEIQYASKRMQQTWHSGT